MVGLIGDGLASSATEDARGLDAFPSTTGDVLGSAFGEGFLSSPGPRLLRFLSARTDDARFLPALPGDVGPYDPEPAPPPPMLDPAEADDRFGIPGVLKFDRPVSVAVASSLYAAKRDQAARQDAIARSPGGLVAGMPGQLAAGFVGGMLDPVNLAAAFIPGVGEARIGSMLGMSMVESAAGRVAAETVGGRLATRALSGASAGAAGMVALEPLNYALDQAEGEDWTMAQALRNIAFGTVLGGGLHVLAGAGGDALTRRRGDVAAVVDRPAAEGVAPPLSASDWDQAASAIRRDIDAGWQFHQEAMAHPPSGEGLIAWEQLNNRSVAVHDQAIAAMQDLAERSGQSLSKEEAQKLILAKFMFGEDPLAGFSRPGESGAARSNPLSARIDALDPEARETLLRGAVAQHVDGRPVRVAEAMDALEARQVEAELTRWHREQVATEAEAFADRGDAPSAPDRTGVIENGRTRLADLRAEADALRAEAEGARARAEPDPVTAERLGAIEEELGGTTTAKRRAELEQERTLLTEGRDAGADALERGRAQSEAEGLERAQRRADAATDRAVRAQNALELRAGAEADTTAALQVVNGRADRIRMARLSGREAAIRDMTERSIRRLAGRAGVSLEAAEVRDLARTILTAQPDQAGAAIEAVTQRLNRAREGIGTITPDTIAGAVPERAPGGDALSAEIAAPFRAEASAAVEAMRQPAPADPALAQADRAAAATAERAPQVATTRGQAAQAEAQQAADTLMARVETEVAAGRMAERDAATVREAVRGADGEASAYEAAAACMARRMV